MIARINRHTRLALCVLLFAMAGQAYGDDVAIVPPNPTSNDVVSMTLSGMWSTSCCPPVASTVTVSGNDIYFGLIVPDICIYMICDPIPWQQIQSVGPLSPGVYTLWVYLPDEPCTEVMQFTVSPVTITVRLPELEGRFMTYETLTATFDLGWSPLLVSQARIRFKGTFYPGKAYWWYDDPSQWFYYGDSTWSIMDPPESQGRWEATGEYFDTFRSFIDESTFSWHGQGAPSWVFLLDGQGQVATRLNGIIPISLVILEGAKAYIDEAYLTVDLAEEKIRLTSPDGNEMLPASSTYAIQWADFRDGGCSHNYNLQYSTDAGQNWIPIGSVADGCSYDWLIPEIDSNNCLVKILDADATGIYDTSNGPFTIYRPHSDLTGDCFVDFVDYAILSLNWQESPDPCDPNSGDIVKNGIVDIYDLALLVEQWLTCFVTEATGPEPGNNVVNVSSNVILRWSPGENCTSHDVYFGTDFNDVNDADIYEPDIYMGNQDVNYWDTNDYDSNGLEPDTMFYWRINEIAGCIAKGDVWSFTTCSGPSIVAGLVALWDLDEGDGDIAHDSAGYNDGTLNGDPQWVAGKVGPWAIDCDGDGDHIQVPDDDSLTPSSAITIALWLYNRGGQMAGIYKYADCPDQIGKGSPGNSRAYYFVVDSSNRANLCVHQTRNSYDGITSTGTVSLNQWHHIAATFDSGQAVVYIDGQPDNAKTLSVSSIMNDAQPLIIGGYWEYCTPAFVNCLNGQVDDVRIYDRALSAEEILALMEPNLVAHWKFDEGAGTIAHDSAGDNDGTLVNGATWVTGQIAGALDFDGDNDYVVVADDESQQITTNQITLSAWIKLDADVGNTQRRIICKQEAACISWGLEIFGDGYYGSSGNQLVFHDSDGKTAWRNCISPTDLGLSQWYHVAVTDNAGEIRIYLDGQLNQSSNGGYGIPENISAPINIGCVENEKFFNGVIDDIRFYDQALSAEEIEQLYQSGL